MVPVMKRTARQTSHPDHAHGTDETLERQSVVRLKRIEGQIRGLQKMVDEQRYCADVLVQIAAVQESLRAVARLLLRNHLQFCATEAIRSDDTRRRDDMYDELTDLFAKLVR
jgi:CsoR family transcriptional regulator, copper-sensing transcriptional repressor